jgi:MFS transporter, UMF1 family
VTAKPSRRALAAWCLYDWANSAFPTVIETFIFSAFFARAVASDVATGTEQWGYALAAAGVAVAVFSPILGAVADRAGARKPWLLAATLMTATAAAMLWFTKPAPDYVTWALIWFALGTIAFEFGTVFYNAMLPDLVPEEKLGRLSGWGWGLGYAGGLACLVIALFGLIRAEPFGLDPAVAEPVRATALLVAGWTIVFALPLLLFTPDRKPTGISAARAVREGLAALWRTLREARRYGNMGRFLIARMVYTDGLNTVFAFGGIYAAGTFGMATDEIIMFGIALNVTAGLGAAAFAWVDDWIGPKPTILIALAGLMAAGAALVLVEDKTLFWALGLVLGIFFGPAQAASRSLMARLVPRGMEAEMFGLYALTGKATAFAGPLLLGWATVAYDSQRAGMATTLAFLVLGFLLLLFVRAPGSSPRT